MCTSWLGNVGLRWKKKKFARNWLKFCMIVYDTILSIHAKNCSENYFKRRFYGTAWSRCAHFCHHGLILALARQGLGGEKKKVARNWLKFCMIVYGTILSIHAKNCSENSFKRSFYGTAWSRCAHFCHHGLIFGLGGQKKKKFSELSQILHGSLWPHCKHSRKKSWPNSLK